MSVHALKLAYERAEPAVQTASSWPSPIALPSKLPAVPLFDPALVPAQLRPWVLDIAARMQVPLDFVAIPAMVAAGSLIGRRVGIRPEMKTDWLEVANLWGCVVATPGAMKSPAIGEALAPIRRLEATATAENEAALVAFRKAETVHKLELDAAKDRAKKELKDGCPEVARAILEDVQEPAPPAELRFLASDVTVGKLGEICAANPMGVLLNRDELLTMLVDLHRDEKASTRGFLLTGWSGRDGYTFDRISRGTVRIEAVNISIIGSTQPQRLASYLRDSLRTHDDGMVQRLQLLTWPDHKGKWENSDRYPDAAAKAQAIECYEYLSKLDADALGAERCPFDEGDGVPFLRFDEEALGEFVSWRGDLENRLRDDELPSYLSAHLSKYRGLIPRLALIYHIASGRTGEVSLEAALAALAWAEYLEAHAVRAYSSMTATKTETAEAILRRIRKGDIENGFTDRDIYRKGWSRLTDREAVAEALGLLEDYDWLRSEKVITGGRPSTKWWINPEAAQ